MEKKTFWGKYKSEIVAAVIGALFTGAVSLASGLYSLTKSFEFAQNKEYLVSLRLDIDYLMKIERELDSNINTFLSHDYHMQIETTPARGIFEEFAKLQKSKTKKDIEQLEALKNIGIDKKQHKIKSINVPREFLEMSAWQRRGNLVGDIDFDLNQRIDKIYSKIYRINISISNVMPFGVGSDIGVDRLELIKHHITVNNNLVSELKGDELMALKNDIILEIERLKEARRKITKIF